MAEKSNSRRHSTTGFGVNLSVVETSYQILEILSFAIEIGLLKPPLIKITMLAFLVKIKPSLVCIFWEYAKKKLYFKARPRI